jgi:hypothetical protein
MKNQGCQLVQYSACTAQAIVIPALSSVAAKQGQLPPSVIMVALLAWHQLCGSKDLSLIQAAAAAAAAWTRRVRHATALGRKPLLHVARGRRGGGGLLDCSPVLGPPLPLPPLPLPNAAAAAPRDARARATWPSGIAYPGGRGGRRHSGQAVNGKGTNLASGTV